MKLRLNRFYYKHLKKKKKFEEPLKLHLGCGKVFMKNYINIDSTSNSVADLVSDFRDIDKHFPPNSVSEIFMVHSISYLRFWEGLEFFKDCFLLLKEGGKLIIEFPDIEKCASSMIQNKNDYTNYIEAVRAFYAFDLNQIKKKEKFTTYAFGWSAWHMAEELTKLGFKNIVCSDGILHNQKWRDSHVEATK
jgi:hypothetical protein